MLGLFKKIRDDLQDEWLKSQWVALLPFMTAGLVKDMTYQEYKQKSIITVDMRPAEDIIAEAEEIRRQLEEENGSI